MGPLRGLPGQIATLLARLTSGRASALDHLDADISTRAPASSAVSSATWTSALAAFLALVQKPPVASGLINSPREFASAGGTIVEMGYSDLIQSSTSASSSFVDAVNYSGAGVLQAVWLNRAQNATPDACTIEVIVDGATVLSYTTAAGSANFTYATCVVGGVQRYSDGTNYYVLPGAMDDIPFTTSLQIKRKNSSGNATHSVYYKYRKTS